MPRYFFDIHDGERHDRDENGIDLPGVAYVWEIAVPMVDEIAKAKHGGRPSRTLSVVVRDVHDVVVYRSDVVGQHGFEGGTANRFADGP